MLRRLITIGMIMGFIGSAFVPPTDANFHAAKGFAQGQVGARTAASLLASSGVDRSKVDSAVQVLQDIAPEPKKVVKRVSAATLTAMNLKQTSAYWKQVKKESDDKDLVSRMADIEWATRKQDVRLCAGVIEGTVSRGEYLALCLAKVTGDPARCDQIDASASVLRKLCTEELAT